MHTVSQGMYFNVFKDKQANRNCALSDAENDEWISLLQGALSGV